MKKSKEPTLGDFLTDIEELLKDFKKIQEGNITEKDLEKIDFNSIKKEIDILSKKVTKKYPKDLDSKK